MDGNLELVDSIREQGSSILEGVLRCSNPQCLREYPIIDGIPILISDIRAYISHYFSQIISRTDLSETVESIIGDCCGPNSAYDTIRHSLSIYGWSHYHDLDPLESTQDSVNSTLNLLESALSLVPKRPLGPVIDLGCSVGRTSFGLADRVDDLVLGIDMDFSMLRLAHRILREGIVRYPYKRGGIVYEHREFPVQFHNQESVDFWACDGLALPFSTPTFNTVMSLNLLDCVKHPQKLLVAVRNLLKIDGFGVLTCPYDWSAAVTPFEAWLGGHSQRGTHRGRSDSIMKTLLGDESHPQYIDQLDLVAELCEYPWRLRLHDRSTVEYKTHVVAVKVTGT